MRRGDDIADLQLSAVRQVAYTRRLIDESKRTIRAIQEHCERMQRQVANSRALLQAAVQPAWVSSTIPR